MHWIPFAAVWGMIVAVCLEPVVAEDTPSLEELGRLLVKRSEDLDRVDVTYRREEEFFFPVAGLTPVELKPLKNGRYRTVFAGRKRRFEEYPDEGLSYIVIFDGETTADIQVKRPQLSARGVSVFLHRGITERSAIDCQYCLCALGKPLSDSSQALAYQKELFPWMLLVATDPEKKALFQFDSQPTLIQNRPCYAVRIGDGIDSYWLDSSRNFTLVRRERMEPHNGKKIFDVRSTASDFRQHGEYWIPYSYEREHGAPSFAKERAGQIFYRVKLTVEQIQIGKVSEEDFKMELIDGAPVFDMDTGRMIQNRASRLTEVGSLVAEMNSAHRPWWYWGGIVVAIASLAAVGFWKRASIQNVFKAR